MRYILLRYNRPVLQTALAYQNFKDGGTMMLTWENICGILKPLAKMVMILIIGHVIAVYIVKIIKRAFDRSHIDDSLAVFLLKTIKIVLNILVILSALNTVGVSTNGVLAALSAAAVAVAIALRDSLSNVAGGILLLISPRFLSGDYISAGGDEGTVVRVDLLHTTVRTIDNKLVSIPNGVLINSHITNYTREEKRRVDIDFPVSYEADIEKTKQIIYSVISRHPLVLSEPEEPMVRVMKYNDSSVDIITRSWCNTPDYWTVYFDLTEQVRAELGKNGITIPYNQLDVNIKENYKNRD